MSPVWMARAAMLMATNSPISYAEAFDIMRSVEYKLILKDQAAVFLVNLANNGYTYDMLMAGLDHV